jgi:hypothetical protein
MRFAIYTRPPIMVIDIAVVGAVAVATNPY